MHEPIKCCWLLLSFGILALLGVTTWHQLVVLLWAFLLFVGCIIYVIFMTPFHYRILHMFTFLSVCFFAVLRLIGPFRSPLESFPSISFSIVFAVFFRNETLPPSHLYVRFIIHYMVPQRVGSIVSIVSRVGMDTLLFSLSHSLCLLQRLHSLTHFSNGCSRVSRRLFRDKELCTVYMDETKPIYMSMALVFCCLTLSSIRKILIDQTSVHGEIVSLSTHFIECAYSFPRSLRDRVSR